MLGGRDLGGMGKRRKWGLKRWPRTKLQSEYPHAKGFGGNLWIRKNLEFVELLSHSTVFNASMKDVAAYSNPYVLESNTQPLRRVWLFATPWTGAHQAPLSMGLPRQEYWSGSPFPSPGEYSSSRNWTHISCLAGRFLSCQERPLLENSSPLFQRSLDNRPV